MHKIDLNCDLGEAAGHDEELMPLITSVNIACGAHAGDEVTMKTTVALAQKHGVAIGAHPGYADRDNLGRREIDLPSSVVCESVRSQIETLRTLANVRHVKLHGALYHRASHDQRLAMIIAETIKAIDSALIVFAPPGSALSHAATSCGMRIANEVFADRTYQADGSLTPRSHSGALIQDEEAAVRQVLRMILDGVVRAMDGTEVAVRADTVCIHGDGPDPVGFACRLREALRAMDVNVTGFSPIG